MTRLLIVSDDGVPTGYGRISMEVNTRLARRGYTVMAASYAYDGLLPPTLDGQNLPYHVASLAGKPNWVECVMNLAGVSQPDIIVSIQDFPYAEQIRNAPIDWSRYGFIIITPVDGVPIYPRWLDIMRKADAGLTISEYGVKAFKNTGIPVDLCRPGVNLDKFYRLPDTERAGIRQKLGIAPDAFILGSMCMNQGRKAIPLMLKGFFEFAKDKPAARYLLDMDAQSPAGWDIPALCQQQGWDVSKLLFRQDCARLGVYDLRERYNILDAHAVIAHREGYGLPLAEAMACGVVSIAMDYCSGTEICGDGKGVLVKTIGYAVPGTWGGAEDQYPDVNDFVANLEMLYLNPFVKATIALKGMQWARSHTWDMATDNVQAAIERVMANRRELQAPQPSAIMQLPPAPVMQPDGFKVPETMEVAR